MAGEKRSVDDASEELRQESAILLDIEGTTSSIRFIQDTLFPYIREFLKKHVDEKWNDEEFKADFAKLKEQAKEDEEKKVDGFVPIKEDTEEEAKDTLIKNVLWQMDNDLKTGALKRLQGHMWKAAYKPMKGHVYDDVPKAFDEWTNMGKKLYIYSSGSVEAQKLLYGNSIHGDLLKYISGHFDTTVGPKQEADSYKNILKEINLEPSNVLFLTDVIKEAQAAKEAGLAVTIVIREGNAKLTDDDKLAFKTIQSFAELIFQSTNKRQKLCNDEESKKNDTIKEETAVSGSVNNEPMDTSDDVKATADEKTTDTTIDVKVEELNVEKKVEVEKNVELKESEKEITPMEEDNKPEIKTDAEKNSIEVEKEKTIELEKEETIDAEKDKTIETEKGKTVEKEEKKSIDVAKENEKVSSSEEKTLQTEVPEKTENKTDKGIEKLTEETPDKIANEAATNVEKETKSEEKELKEKELKENGESKISDAEQNNKSADNKVEEIENKENVQSENIDEKVETKAEVAEEIKEATTVESPDSSVKNEKEKVSNIELETVTEKSETKTLNGASSNGNLKNDILDEKVHANGINNKSEKIIENEESEESIKVKKTVADGAGDTDVVVPPVVAATS
ncbi:enolase-phosphatase E1 isoform X2 [Phymastichus coffea]|uniref:enolase-phosphatase E1 isoform X2 n=1 Tax=Phymastichus coffea TaxID=108790 RepID=UPI00273CDAE0|nr:enolase-phosphatase E1 isoform X2 [Phymastichus coffea]